MVDKSTLRIFFSLVAKRKLFLKQGDIVMAYLNADMHNEVYVRLPAVCNDPPCKVRRLLKALYGHPKAGQLWNTKLVHDWVGFLSVL